MSDFDERLQAKEKTLIGKWLLLDGTMVGDITFVGAVGFQLLRAVCIEDTRAPSICG